MSRVLIIGAGVIGMCSAYYARLRGHDVTVIDRNPENYAGCSFGNAGMIVPSHFIPLAAPGAVALGLKWMWNPESPFWIKPRWDAELLDWGIKFWQASNAEHVQKSAPLLRDLHMFSRGLFEQLSQAADNKFGLVTRGLLMLCKTEHALAEESRMAEEANELGVPADVLDTVRLKELDPGVEMNVAGGVYFPKDCHLVPRKFMSEVKRLAKSAGVKIIYEAEAVDANYESGRVKSITTSIGEIEADQFVLCAGSWSPLLGKKLQLRLPIQPGKGYSLTLADPPQLPEICSILVEARIAVTPMGQSLRVGGTMEMAGLNEDINQVRVKGIIKAIPHYFPKFRQDHFEGIKPWSGLRPCSPDGLPYVGKTKTWQNLIVATGHAMMGLSLAPATGHIVGDLLSGNVPETNIGLLNPDRYN